MRADTHIVKVGFEIEGGWDGQPYVPPFEDVNLIEDGSINGGSLREDAIQAPHVGECVSPVFAYSEEEEGKLKWVTWLNTHWPNAEPPHRTNNTCGFHIHISFGNFLDYSLLTSSGALFALREEMVKLGKELKLPKKHEFWRRMNGYNDFCTFETNPAAQMHTRSKHCNRERYGFLNFAWNLHGTVEFRALPTFRDAHIAVAFAERYFDVVDDWLAANTPAKLERITTSFGRRSSPCA
jgi:hypothetical protein